MNRSRVLVAQFLLLASVPLSYAESGQPLTLADALARASGESPDIGARAAALDSARALANSAGRLPDPQLLLGVDNLPVTGPESGSLTNDFMTMRKIGITQAFPSRTKRSARIRRATDAVQLARAEQVLTGLDVKRETAQAWIGAYTAQKTLTALHSVEPSFELQSRIAKAGVASNRWSASDALEAQRGLIAWQDRLAIAEQALRRARAQLARWLPRDADRPLAGTPDFTALPNAQRLTDVRHHAALAAYEARRDAARSDLALARAEKHPDWDMGLTYAKRGAPFSDMVSLEFRVDLPVFPGSRQDPAIAARAAELRKIEAEQEAQWRMHETEVHQAIADWETLKARTLRYRDELLPLARQRVELALASMRSGSGGVKPVLDAQIAQTDTELEAIALEGELGRAWAYLNYLQGEGA